MGAGGSPSATLRSSTGTTAPLTFMTPRNTGEAPGTSVMGRHPTTSRTLSTGMANGTPSSRKVRNSGLKSGGSSASPAAGKTVSRGCGSLGSMAADPSETRKARFIGRAAGILAAAVLRTDGSPRTDWHRTPFRGFAHGHPADCSHGLQQGRLNLEEADHFLQLQCLRAQFLCRGTELFGGGGRLVCAMRKLANGGADLFQRTRLLP